MSCPGEKKKSGEEAQINEDEPEMKYPHLFLLAETDPGKTPSVSAEVPLRSLSLSVVPPELLRVLFLPPQ